MLDVRLPHRLPGGRALSAGAGAREGDPQVLDDTKVPLPSDDVDREWISDTVFEVADGILGQGFEPTPSYAACSMCDYRIACPAAER